MPICNLDLWMSSFSYIKCIENSNFIYCRIKCIRLITFINAKILDKEFEGTTMRSKEDKSQSYEYLKSHYENMKRLNKNMSQQKVIRKGDIELLKTHASKMEERITNFEQEKNIIEKQRSKLKDQVKKLKTEQSDLIVQVNKLHVKDLDKNHYISQLKYSISELKKRQKTVQQKLEDVQRYYDTQRNNNCGLRKALQQQKERHYSQLDKLNSIWRNQKQDLNEQLNYYKQVNIAEALKQTNIDQKNSELEFLNNKQGKELENAKQQINRLETQLKSACQRIEQQQQELLENIELFKNFEEKSVLLMKKEFERREECRWLSEENDGLKKMLESQHAQIRELEKKLDKVSQVQYKMAQQKSKLQDQISIFSERHLDKAAQIAQLKIVSFDKDNQILDLKSKLTEKQQNQRWLQQQKEELKKKLELQAEQGSNLLNDRDQLEDELLKIKRMLFQQIQNKNNLQMVIQQLIEKRDQKIEQMSKMCHVMLQKDSLNQARIIKIQQVSQQQSVDELQDRLVAELNQDMKYTTAYAIKKMQALVKKIKQQQQEIIKRKEQLKKVEYHLEVVQSQLEKQKVQNLQLVQDNADLNDNNVNLSELSTSLLTQISTMQSAKQRLQKEYQNLHVNYRESDRLISEVKRQLQSVKQQKAFDCDELSEIYVQITEEHQKQAKQNPSIYMTKHDQKEISSILAQNLEQGTEQPNNLQKLVLLIKKLKNQNEHLKLLLQKSVQQNRQVKNRQIRCSSLTSIKSSAKNNLETSSVINKPEDFKKQKASLVKICQQNEVQRKILVQKLARKERQLREHIQSSEKLNQSYNELVAEHLALVQKHQQLQAKTEQEQKKICKRSRIMQESYTKINEEMRMLQERLLRDKLDDVEANPEKMSCE